jgi:hypothetical protein
MGFGWSSRRKDSVIDARDRWRRANLAGDFLLAPAMKKPLAILAFLGACADTIAPPAPPEETVLVASKLAILAIGIATGEQGRSFFDNFLPCPRRGIINYRNSPNGRFATLSGCDAGDGVVFDGDIEVRWSGPGQDRDRIEAIEVRGEPTVTVGGNAPVRMETVQISGIAFAPPSNTEPTVDHLVVAPVRVAAFGATTPLDSRATPASVFRPALTGDAIPNPSNSLEALTVADIKRIAFHGAMAIASTLLNETLEIQRGAHMHQLPCGTLTVTPLPTNLPRLDMSWNACDLRYGLFVGGTFSTEWAEFSGQGDRIVMNATGDITLGGGVPKVTLSRIEWIVSGLDGFPGVLTISGRLVSGARQSAFSFQVHLDD